MRIFFKPSFMAANTDQSISDSVFEMEELFQSSCAPSNVSYIRYKYFELLEGLGKLHYSTYFNLITCNQININYYVPIFCVESNTNLCWKLPFPSNAIVLIFVFKIFPLFSVVLLGACFYEIHEDCLDILF